MVTKGLVDTDTRPPCGTTFPDRCPDSMQVLAGGIDIVDLDRLVLAIRRSGTGFTDRVLRPDEREFVATASHDIDVNQFAILFGAKEAAVKVLRGLPAGASLRDITARPEPGPMELALHGPVREWAARQGIRMLASALAISDRALLTWVLATPPQRPSRLPGA